MKRDKLFCIGKGKGSTLSMPIASEGNVSLVNQSSIVQTIGDTTIQPGTSITVPTDVGMAMLRRPEFKVEKPSINWEPGDKLQVSRFAGLGDLIFLVAACHGFHMYHPDVRIYVDAHPDHHEWLSWVPFINVGKCNDPKFVVGTTSPSLVHTDRVNHIAEQIGIEHHDIRFPIDIPNTDACWLEDPILFAPYSAGAGARSLLASTVTQILERAPEIDRNRFVFVPHNSHRGSTGALRYSTGPLTIGELWELVSVSTGVITVDTGVAWMAAALGKPVLVFYTHSRPQETANACSDIMAVEPVVPCAPCGLRDGDYPCEAGNHGFQCQSYYDWRVVMLRMAEFIKLVQGGPS